MKTLIASGSLALFTLFAACGGAETPKQTPATGAGADASKPAPQGAPQQDPKTAAKPAAKKAKIDPMMVKQLFGSFPSGAPEAPVASTPELVALGKALYFDESLSAKGNQSCNSCHDLSTYGVDNKPVSPGSLGENGARNSPTTYNAFRQFTQFWDGRAKSVEEQALKPVLNPVEHGVKDEAELVAKLKAKPETVAAFQKAFPGAADAVTADNFGIAVGAFERTLATRSRWDDYVDGKKNALSNDEQLGLQAFIENQCIVCHTGRLLGGHMFQKVGLMKVYSEADAGRSEVTKNDAEKYFFKVPTLVNVEKTAPYYHDGKIATLEDAIHNMAEIHFGKNLDQETVASIAMFLKATTGELPAEFKK